METIKLYIYTALLISALIETSANKCCNDDNLDSTKRLRRQMPFVDMNTFYISPDTDPYTSSVRNFGLIVPPPINNEVPDAMKAYSCSIIHCDSESRSGPVCACNFNTGNVVSFKNQCDVVKHNCRFDTEFKVILNGICPWEFQSRRDNKPMEFDYTNSKYYN